MATEHSTSVFTNSCLSVPRRVTNGATSMNDPTVTGVLSTTEKSVGSPSNTQSPHPITALFDPGQVEENDQSQDRDIRKEYAMLFSTLQESNALLLEEIQSLQQSQLSTVKGHFNESPPDKKSNAGDDRYPQSLTHNLSQNTWVGVLPNSLPQDVNADISDRRRDYVISDWTSTVIEDIEPTGDIDSNSDSVMEHSDDEGDTSLDTSGESHSTSHSVLSREVQPNSDPFASPGSLVIDGMWDDFSVDEYASYESMTEYTNEGNSNKNKSKQWTPKITVPEPFSMTVRESLTPKRKSRSLLIAEQERLEKTAQEEAELMKKIRATPVPASTFLPIYELVNAKNEQRRRDIKILSKEILKSSEKPFKFMKREQSTKELRAKQAAQIQKVESDHLQKRKFKAKPVPKHIFDPTMNELLEQEEYRKIRIQMRSKELLASSKLPGTMCYNNHKISVQANKIVSGDSSDRIMPDDNCRFQPSINKAIPDYDRAYFEFQKKLTAMKKKKCPTRSKPFHLQTQHIPSRKQQVVEDIQRDSLILLENRWPFITPRAKVSRKSPEHTRSKTMSSVLYPAKMTETTRLRQSLTREKLNQCLEKEVSKEQQRSEQRQRERSIQQAVAQKSISLDPTPLLEEKKRQKLQEFHMLDKMKKKSYQQKLSEINERVQSRPLLLEQVSHASKMVKQSAEAKCNEALNIAGLSDEVTHTQDDN